MTLERKRVAFEAAVELEIENMQQLRERLLEQHGSMAKWLLATLVAVNGGAAVSLPGLVEQGIDIRLPGALFVAGIMAGLAGGVLTQKANNRGLEPIGARIADYLFVLEHGEPSPTAADTEQKFKDLNRWMQLPPAAGWVSAGLFVAGAGFLGVALS